MRREGEGEREELGGWLTLPPNSYGEGSSCQGHVPHVDGRQVSGRTRKGTLVTKEKRETVRQRPVMV